MDCVYDALFLVNRVVMQAKTLSHDDDTWTNKTFDRSAVNRYLLIIHCYWLVQLILLRNLYSSYCKLMKQKHTIRNSIVNKLHFDGEFWVLFDVSTNIVDILTLQWRILCQVIWLTPSDERPLLLNCHKQRQLL